MIYAVARQLQNQTQISSQTPIRYFGEDAKAFQWNSAITTDPIIHNKWPLIETLVIEVEEEFDTDKILNMQTHNPEVPFVFLDSELGVYLKPAYSTQNITIRFKYVAKDRNQAIKWRNEIRTKISQLRSALMHELTYSYHLPEQYIDLIREIYTLREAIGGYGDSFNKYLAEHSTSRLTTLSNQNGSTFIYAVAETQAGIVGSFDFEGFPEKPEKDGDTDNFAISFSYKFRYEKPISVVCKYPSLVHQQFLPEKYWPRPAYDLTKVFKRLTNSGESFANFQIDNINNRMMADKGLVIPPFDEFLPAFIPPFTLKVLSVLLTISVDDKRTLLNLKQLGDFNFKQEILDFMVGEAAYMPKVMGSIFYCQLYENENAMAEPILSIDSNLNVVALKDLDVRKQYRIRISLVGDLSMVNTQGLARLKASVAARTIIIDAINASLTNSGNQKALYKNQLTANDYRILGIKSPGMVGLGHSLVQYLYVMAYRMDAYTGPEVPAPDANTTATPNMPTFTNIGTGSP